MDVNSILTIGEKLKGKFIRGELDKSILGNEDVQALFDFEWENIESGKSNDLEVIDFCVDYFMMNEDNISSKQAGFLKVKGRLQEEMDFLYDTEPINNKPKIYRLLAVACTIVVIILSLQTVSVAYGGNLIKMILQRSEELLMFFTSDSHTIDINIGLEPTWLPEGYILSEKSENNVAELTTIKYMYTNISNEVLFVYIYIWDSNESNSIFYEIDNEFCEEFIFNDILHYIETNNETLMATWQYENRNYIISGQLDVEVIKKMIISFYYE